MLVPFISGDITVSQTNDKDWKLIEPVVYQGQDQTFTVPKGFITDFASVPRIFFWLFPSYGTYTKSAILHDYFCDTAIVNRADADGLFRRTMRELGVPFLRRWIMWTAVRASSHFKGATPQELALGIAIAIPAVIFLFIPALAVSAALIIFWLAEYILYWGLRPFSRKQVNFPKIWPSR